MPLLQACLSHEGNDADQITVCKSAQVEAAFRRIAESRGYGFNGSGSMLLRRLPESQRLAFQSFQSNLPPRRGMPGPPTAGNPSTASLSSCPQLNAAYQPVTYAYLWSLPGPMGGSQFILCYTSVFVRTAFWGSGYTSTQQFQDVSRSVNMLQSVVLPNGSAWTFLYDAANPSDTTSIAYGDLLKIGFPTGGSISYAYTTASAYSGYYSSGLDTTQSRSVISRSVDANDGTGPHTSTYNWGTPLVATSTTYTVENVVTDPLGNDTVHVISGLYGGPLLYETQTRTYQGSKSSGTLLKTVNTDYSYSTNPFDQLGLNVNPPTAINVVPIHVTTIWPNGQTSKEETDHDSAFIFRDPTWGLPIYPPRGSTSATYSGTLGAVTARREYDYGSGNPGNLLGETFTTYLWQNNSNYLNANLLDLPATVTFCSPLGSGESGDATGCSDPNFTLKRRSQTVSGYDDSSRLFAANIGTQHGAPPGGVRGNLTSVAHWLNTSGCDPQTAGSCPTSYTNWYDTGEVYQSIDPLGHTTTHRYDAAYAGAYPTQTCNALSQCVSGAYDSNSGLLTSFTDANSQSSTYSYDTSWRMTSAVFPADSSGYHPETDFSYPNVTTVQRSKKQDATPHWIVDYAYFDGVGRTKQTQLVDPEGDDFVDTTYDGLGRVSTVSNPHRSSASSTDGITTTYYDALGRVTQIAAQDGSISTTDYSNFPTVTMTDPAGKMRRSRSDALGRLVEVDEPGPGVNGPGTPGQGSISISGSLAVTSSTSATTAQGSVTISGSEQQITRQCCCHLVGGVWTCQQITSPDTGTVSITVNGFQASYTYGQNDSSYSIASALIGSLNSGSPVTASLSSGTTCTTCTISLTSNVSGSAGNYPLSANFPSISFSASTSGANLTGGADATTTYDSGTLTVTVNGFQASASYNQNLNSTALAMAQALTSALNASSSPVTASNNGTTINMTAKGVGTATNFAVTGSSTASFTASSTTLSGGTNPGGFYADYVTNYSHDPLGNLTQVNQLGDGSQAARVRTFTYDSLSRLLTANNPESGQISYSYDADGNLLHKTSPQANQTGSATQTISYCYDVLNRPAGKGYGVQSCPLASPAVTYTYDQGANGIGHLSSLTDQAGSGTYTYDPLGRISGESRTIAGVTKSMGYAYNLDGSAKTLNYPSQAQINYSYSTAGRLGAATDGVNNINYITGATGPGTLATHAPDGSSSSFVSGYATGFAGITNSFSHNQRLQPVNMSAASPTATVFSINYDFHVGNGNNGNVWGIVNNKDATRNQTFTYDQLNRLTSAQNAGTDCGQTLSGGKTKYWGNSYVYDAWGNLLSKIVTKCQAENMNYTAATNNQLQGLGYDAAGNMTTDNFAQSYTYDPENRIIGAPGYAYTYDSDGNRVEKATTATPPTGTLYWYMTPGIVAESDLLGNLQSEYVFFDGERVARKDFPSNAVSYYFSDHLKTATVLTDSAGNIKSESDYYPWGGELQFLANDSNHYKFTGKERDNETQLDYFGARYYSNGLGRWVSADWSAMPVPVPYADLSDPQSLNLYSYVRNVPTTTIDADGHCDWCHDAVDFVGGVAQGIVSSASWGLVGAPKSSDSNASLAGQSVGTAIEGGVSTSVALDGLKNAGAGLLATPETGPIGLGVAVAGGVEALVGAAGAVGAAKNSGAILNAMAGKNVPPSERDPQRRFTPEESKELKNRAQRQCETCGKQTVNAKPYTKGSKHSPREGQAGHKKAWSRGGRTTLKNGKWQCRECNQKEGANSK